MSEVCVDSQQLENAAYSLGRLFDLLNKTQGHLEKNKMLFSQSNSDAKSKEIISIISDCQKSIKIVQRELYSCHQKLAKLNETAVEYNGIRLEYGESERRMVNLAGRGLAFISGITEPTGTVSRAAGDFAEVATPVIYNVSEQLMQQVHEAYDTSADRFVREHPFRDEDGNIV